MIGPSTSLDHHFSGLPVLCWLVVWLFECVCVCIEAMWIDPCIILRIVSNICIKHANAVCLPFCTFFSLCAVCVACFAWIFRIGIIVVVVQHFRNIVCVHCNFLWHEGQLIWMCANYPSQQAQRMRKWISKILVKLLNIDIFELCCVDCRLMDMRIFFFEYHILVHANARATIRGVVLRVSNDQYFNVFTTI